MFHSYFVNICSYYVVAGQSFPDMWTVPFDNQFEALLKDWYKNTYMFFVKVELGLRM